MDVFTTCLRRYILLSVNPQRSSKVLLKPFRAVLNDRRDVCTFLLGRAQVHPCNARSPTSMSAHGPRRKVHTSRLEIVDSGRRHGYEMVIFLSREVFVGHFHIYQPLKLVCLNFAG